MVGGPSDVNSVCDWPIEQIQTLIALMVMANWIDRGNLTLANDPGGCAEIQRPFRSDFVLNSST